MAPTLPVIPTQTVNELTLLTVTNTATNANIHSTITGYALVNPPAGAAINANGIITWTPSQTQSPGTNTITTVVTNTNPYDLVNPNLTRHQQLHRHRPGSQRGARPAGHSRPDGQRIDAADGDQHRHQREHPLHHRGLRPGQPARRRRHQMPTASSPGRPARTKARAPTPSRPWSPTPIPTTWSTRI